MLASVDVVARAPLIPATDGIAIYVDRREADVFALRRDAGTEAVAFASTPLPADSAPAIPPVTGSLSVTLGAVTVSASGFVGTPPAGGSVARRAAWRRRLL